MHTTTVTAKTQPTAEQTAAREHLKEVAHQFESIFTSMMIKSMRSTVGEDPLVKRSTGEEIFTSMLDEEYGKQMSSGSKLGLSDLIVKELEKLENPSSALDGLKALGGSESWKSNPLFIPKSQPTSEPTTSTRFSQMLMRKDGVSLAGI